MRILLIAGGWSSERQVSLSGARMIEEALVRLGHTVTFFDLSVGFDKLVATAQQHDFSFINLHGSPGEDGLVQAMLDIAGLPYQGSGPRGSFLALHKAASKQLFREKGLRTPDWVFLTEIPPEDFQLPFDCPAFVKSNNGGSSLHLYQISDQTELRSALRAIFEAGLEVIVEPLIAGREVTCGMLGEEVLPPVFIEPLRGGFFDYDSKYTQGGARELCPAPISEAATREVQNMTVDSHKALGLSGYSRADFILTDDDVPWLLEINTLPGMTATSLIPQEAAVVGYNFDQLIARLIELGLEARRL
jgi:D-alanine-D-alanine ligase